MVILEQPYASDVLLEYLEKNQAPVLENGFSQQQYTKGKKLNLISGDEFKEGYKSLKKIYTISEYTLEWVMSKLNDEGLNRQVTLLKNKVAFREASRDMYPNFIFKEINYDDLFTYDTSELRFPVVLKPAVGFLSAGVYIIDNLNDWQEALRDVQTGFETQAKAFPEIVVGREKFILESYIGGKEYAIDLYFRGKEPVIVNIFEHPFSSGKDVSDRLYFTSKQIFDEYLERFTKYAVELNKFLDLENIPVHIELRVDGDNIIPIEINPLRFTGMCLNELNRHITGKHPLDFYFSDTAPDYKSMWKGKEDQIFFFSIVEKPNDPSEERLTRIKNAHSNILEFRKLDNPSLQIEAFIFAKTNDPAELENILKTNV